MAQTKKYIDLYEESKRIYVNGNLLLITWSEYALKDLDFSKPANYYLFVLVYAKVAESYIETLVQSLRCVKEAIRIQPNDYLCLLLESVILYILVQEKLAILSFRRAFCSKNPAIPDPLYGRKFSDKKTEYEKAISKIELHNITEVLELSFWGIVPKRTLTIEQLEQQFLECQEIKEKIEILQKINKMNRKNKSNPQEVCDFILQHIEVLLKSEIPHKHELFYIRGDCFLVVDILKKSNIKAAQIYFTYTDGLREATSKEGRIIEHLNQYKNSIIKLIRSISKEEDTKKLDVVKSAVRDIKKLKSDQEWSIDLEKFHFCLGDIYAEIEDNFAAVNCYLDAADYVSNQSSDSPQNFSRKITNKLTVILRKIGAEEMGEMLNGALNNKGLEPSEYYAEIWKKIGAELYHSETRKHSPTKKGYLLAIKAFTKALEYAAEEHQANLLVLRGRTYLKLESYVASRKDLEEALEKDKNSFLLTSHLYRNLIKSLAEIYLKKELPRSISFQDLFDIERGYYEQRKKEISETYYRDDWEEDLDKCSRRISEIYYVQGCLIYEKIIQYLDYFPPYEFKKYLDRSLNAYRKSFNEIQANWATKGREDNSPIDYFMLEIITGFIIVGRGIITGLVGHSRDMYENYSQATERELKGYKEIQEYLNKGSNILSKLLERQKEGKLKKYRHIRELDLQRKFDIIESFRISSFSERIALEQAEIRKNICLTKLFSNNKESESESESKEFTYKEIGKILDMNTAIVYWHIGITEITSFILLENWNSEININKITLHYGKYTKFQENILSWESIINDIGKYPSAGFFAKMEKCLNNFYNTLDIEAILKILYNNKRIKNVILIPHRALHKVPLHIFFNNLNYGSKGRNNNYNLSYLPSIKLGLELDSNVSFIPSLLVIHPFNVSNQDLLSSYAESAGVFLRFCDAPPKIPEKLEGDPGARREKVSRKLEVDINSSFFHFLGHAYHNFNKPQDSALKLTGDKHLTLKYILNRLDLSNYYLVCLSACETGVTSTMSPLEEYVGLVSAFLEKGVSYVISSLWKIEDISTSFLMIELYRLISIGEHPVKALEKTQRWLRTASREKLSYWCKTQAFELYEIINKLLIPEHEKLKLKDSIQVIEDYSYILSDLPPVPFKHPYYWAGFIITGLPPLTKNSSSSIF